MQSRMNDKCSMTPEPKQQSIRQLTYSACAPYEPIEQSQASMRQTDVGIHGLVTGVKL